MKDSLKKMKVAVRIFCPLLKNREIVSSTVLGSNSLDTLPPESGSHLLALPVKINYCAVKFIRVRDSPDLFSNYVISGVNLH